MRAFITGGTGYIGSAVVAAFLRAGHQVTALARSPEGAAKLRDLGATPVPGDLRDPGGFAPAAAEHDTVILIAQDFAAADRREADRAVVDAILSARGPSAPPLSLVYTSNAFLLGNQGPGPLHEDDPWPEPPQWGAWRLEVERHVLERGSNAVAAAVIRPGQVYGGVGGTFPLLFESAAEGSAAYVGTGENRWPLVHRDDLAELYLRVAGHRARGIYHAVEETPLPVAEIAQWASRAAGRGGATRSIPVEEARESLGGFADMLCLDVAAGACRARALGWSPRRTASPGEIEAAYREWRGLPG